MKLFITGGSGFVGGHLIERLCERHEVLAMARSPRSAEAVRALGATPVMADLNAVSAEQLAGVDVVIHAAAYVEAFGPREDFERVNIEGTRRLLAAAKEAGARRFVHISTEAVLFDGAPLIDVSEDAPYPRQQRFLYSETKAAAERLVIEADGPGFTTLILRPRLIWGPRDTTLLPEILKAAEAGAFSWIDGGRSKTSTVHVYNLVAATELALTRGEGGGVYFICDDGQRSYRDFLSALAATRGVALPARSIPGWLARGAAALAEGAWTWLPLSGAPPITRMAVAMLAVQMTVSAQRARDELGYAPVVGVTEGLAALSAAQ